MQSETTTQKILEDIQYATIATANSAGDPWNTPVFYAFDNFTIFWSSHPESVHSKNIAASGKAFIVIYNSKAGTGEGMGLYIKAEVDTLKDKQDIQHALDLLGTRRGRPFLHIEKFVDDGPQRIYAARVIEIWTNKADQDSDGDFIRDYRISIKTN